MARKSVKNQKQNGPQEKPEQQESAPSAADFLNQTQQDDQTDASADYSEANQPEQSAEEPETVPPAAPKPEPAKTVAKPKQNVRETKQSARLGDPCPVEGCPGNIISYSRSRKGNRVTHFLECSNCKTKPTPSKQVINYGH